MSSAQQRDLAIAFSCQVPLHHKLAVERDSSRSGLEGSIPQHSHTRTAEAVTASSHAQFCHHHILRNSYHPVSGFSAVAKIDVGKSRKRLRCGTGSGRAAPVCRTGVPHFIGSTSPVQITLVLKGKNKHTFALGKIHSGTVHLYAAVNKLYMLRIPVFQCIDVSSGNECFCTHGQTTQVKGKVLQSELTTVNHTYFSRSLGFLKGDIPHELASPVEGYVMQGGIFRGSTGMKIHIFQSAGLVTICRGDKVVHGYGVVRDGTGNLASHHHLHILQLTTGDAVVTDVDCHIRIKLKHPALRRQAFLDRQVAAAEMITVAGDTHRTGHHPLCGNLHFFIQISTRAKLHMGGIGIGHSCPTAIDPHRGLPIIPHGRFAGNRIPGQHTRTAAGCKIPGGFPRLCRGHPRGRCNRAHKIGAPRVGGFRMWGLRCGYRFTSPRSGCMPVIFALLLIRSLLRGLGRRLCQEIFQSSGIGIHACGTLGLCLPCE